MPYVDKIIDDFKNNKENIDQNLRDDFELYKKIFIQRYPRYATKGLEGKNWRTKNKTLSDPPILAHLYGKYYIGVLAQWYPQFAVLDIDDRPIEFAYDLRDSMNLDDSNSMLWKSESPGCCHLLFKPSFNDKPPTIKLLHSIFKAFSLQNQVELYPDVNRIFRSPFNPYQESIDPAYYNLDTWQEKLYWYEKLDNFDLSVIPGQQLSLDLQYENTGKILNIMQEAHELLEYGLQCHPGRYDSQFKILYSLWRKNIPQNQAEYIVFKWIREKHNGFSKTIKENPIKVKKEIKRQADKIFNDYSLSDVYPDSTNNLYNGYIANNDIPEILKHCSANLPETKFLFNILKYTYPRRQRDFINVHSDKLIGWSSWRTYLKYLNEFESRGILKRGKAFCENEFSKSIKMNWKYRSSQEAILYDGRSIDSLYDTLRFLYKPRELRQLLESSGSSLDASYKATKRIFEYKQTTLQI